MVLRAVGNHPSKNKHGLPDPDFLGSAAEEAGVGGGKPDSALDSATQNAGFDTTTTLQTRGKGKS